MEGSRLYVEVRHLTWGEVSWRWRLTSWGWRWEYQSWLIQPLSQRVINYRYFLHQPTLLLSSARTKILESHSKNALILLPSLQFQMPCSTVKPNPNKPIVRSKCTIWPNLLNIPALPPTHWSYWWCSLVTVSLSLAALPERITPHHSPRKHEDPKYSFFCLHSIREPKKSSSRTTVKSGAICSSSNSLSTPFIGGRVQTPGYLRNFIQTCSHSEFLGSSFHFGSKGLLPT